MNKIDLDIEKIDISKKKILFVGYGAVAKCVLSYFEHYFIFDLKNVFIVEKNFDNIYGPIIDKIDKQNIMYQSANSKSFLNVLNYFEIREQDIIIDLAFKNNCYDIIKICLTKKLNYINSAICDSNDACEGMSIDIQQKKIHSIHENLKKNKEITGGNALVQCGMNPGLVQHFILKSLNEMNKLYHNTTVNDYSKETLLNVIDNYEIGTIHCSEIDEIKKKNKKLEKFANKSLCNSWSIVSLLEEAFEPCELTQGINNKFIKPKIPREDIDYKKTKIISNNTPKDQKYKVFFLKDVCINYTLNSICPIINNVDQSVFYQQYEGYLIHHGEMFEMANYFGEKAPFISYVYKLNPYANESINYVYFKNKDVWKSKSSFLSWVRNTCYSNVFNNIDDDDTHIGYDSVGCTIFCGKETIERAFWCGSILSHNDKNVDANFIPTIIQVAAGVLSGLSHILENENKNKELLFPCDLNTEYILKKSVPLLGNFFFKEIPKQVIPDKFVYNHIKR